jgi:hypothetical protein
MNKLLPLSVSIALIGSAVSLLPLSTSAHHTSSHVTDVAVEKQVVKRKKKTKKTRTRSTPQQPRSTKKEPKKPDTKPTPPNGKLPTSSSSPEYIPGITEPPSSMSPTLQPGKPLSPKPRAYRTPLPKPSETPKSDVPTIVVPSPGRLPNPAGNLPDVPNPPNVPTRP